MVHCCCLVREGHYKDGRNGYCIEPVSPYLLFIFPGDVSHIGLCLWIVIRNREGPIFFTVLFSISSAGLIAMNLVTQFFHQDVHSRGVRTRWEGPQDDRWTQSNTHTQIHVAHMTALLNHNQTSPQWSYQKCKKPIALTWL